MSHPFLWYRDKDSLKIGGVNRYTIRYRRIDKDKKELYYRLKNIEKASIRAIHLLNGPFILYSHVVPYRYDSKTAFHPENIKTNKETVFDNQIKPGRTFNVRLRMNDNSFVETVDDEDIFQWEIDVVSQIVITRNTSILYDFMIGDDFKDMKNVNHGSLQNSLSTIGNFVTNNEEAQFPESDYGKSTNPQLSVVKKTTDDIWTAPAPRPEEPVHLVIITHGLFSNLTADMLYVKDSLEKSSPENLLVRGYRDNAGRTEKGVKRLGTNAGKYLIQLIEELSESNTKLGKISFIGHSLGGLVQLFAIKYVIVRKGPDYFEKHGLIPHNLVCMASPLLGILSEMSLFISWFLDLGTLGKTGRDLTLTKRIPSFHDIKRNHEFNHGSSISQEEEIRIGAAFKSLLEVLPEDPLQKFLGKFKHLTLYANAVNDGIVPLRTSSLLYLDWKALGDITELKKKKDTKLNKHGDPVDKDKSSKDETPGSSSATEDSPQGHSARHSISSNVTKDSVGEVQDDDEQDEDEQNSSKGKIRKKGVFEKYKDFLKLNFNVEGKTGPTHGPKHKKLSRKERSFLKITAKGSDYYDMMKTGKVKDKEDDASERDTLNGSEDEEDESSDESEENVTFSIPPKASAVESAINSVICPIPSTEYFLDPEHRDEVIFHDKYYHFKDMPKEEEEEHTRSRFGSFLFRHSDWKLHKQVIIAKKYHTSQLNWRKVLVNLPPDAHNNIIVRRRFPNGYGWGVVDHLCENLFQGEQENDDDNGIDTGTENVKAKM